MTNQKQRRGKALFTNLLVFLLATILWVPCIHLFFRPDITQYRSHGQIPVKARMLLARHLQIWSEPALRQKELAKMQERNPEWDFMSRTYVVLALANIALADETYQKQGLEIIDTIIDNTIRLENEQGLHYFLMNFILHPFFSKHGVFLCFGARYICLQIRTNSPQTYVPHDCMVTAVNGNHRYSYTLLNQDLFSC